MLAGEPTIVLTTRMLGSRAVSQPYLNSSPPGKKWPPFRRRHFQIHFRECKALYFDTNLTEFFFRMAQRTINQHWFRYWLGADQATRRYLNQCWTSSLTHIFRTRGRRVWYILSSSRLYTEWPFYGNILLWMVCPFVVVPAYWNRHCIQSREWQHIFDVSRENVG